MVKPRAGGKAGKEKHESSVRGADIAETSDQEFAQRVFDQVKDGGAFNDYSSYDERRLLCSLKYVTGLVRDQLPAKIPGSWSKEARQVIHALEMLEALINGESHPINRYVKGIRSVNATNRPPATELEQTLRGICAAYITAYAEVAGISERKAASILEKWQIESFFECRSAEIMRKYKTSGLDNNGYRVYQDKLNELKIKYIIMPGRSKSNNLGGMLYHFQSDYFYLTELP